MHSVCTLHNCTLYSDVYVHNIDIHNTYTHMFISIASKLLKYSLVQHPNEANLVSSCVGKDKHLTVINKVYSAFVVYYICSHIQYLHCVYIIIRRHDSDVYLGMSPVQNGGSYLMY